MPPEPLSPVPTEAPPDTAEKVRKEAWTELPVDVREAVGDAWEDACGTPWRVIAVANVAYAAGVAEGRLQAIAYLEQRAEKIRASATCVPDKGLAAALFNVARELAAEPPQRQEAPGDQWP